MADNVDVGYTYGDKKQVAPQVVEFTIAHEPLHGYVKKEEKADPVLNLEIKGISYEGEIVERVPGNNEYKCERSDEHADMEQRDDAVFGALMSGMGLWLRCGCCRLVHG